ncbi:PilZ domain-containing protein [Erysipelatoclostridium sp. AM42-17]|uniref:PilZ domain-containing protein n=1 Tax=Erysipelatoclostridium sp. AM42-17 TaxID=2293102 RepID=UPI000E55047A|nr:PilZ domain-containing protein [Erysipelatoclostridium sp. AM42-17]RHS93701.1 hypothetical protein DW911_06190 [Erysipelatoclostridium sp. AM42-17]
MFALFDFQVVNTDFISLLIFWLPAYFFYSMSMRYLSSNIRNQRWSQVIDTILAPYLIFPVILETLHIHQRKFKVTSKKKDHSRKKNIVYALPHMILLVLSILAIIRFVRGKYGWALIYSSIIIFWLVYNLVAIIYALFFMLGRNVLRKSERIKAKTQVKVNFYHYHVIGTTNDVSDEGMSIVVNQDQYIPDDCTVDLEVKDGHYQAHLIGNVVHVRKHEKGWLYALEVKPVDDQNKSQYMQIIYDRNHSLPVEMDLWSTAYDDMTRNISSRMNHLKTEKRKQPRFKVHQPVTFVNGASGIIEDFNYHYVAMSHFKEGKGKPDTYVLKVNKNLWLVLKTTDRIVKNGQRLFKIDNMEELLENNQLNDLLKELNLI